MNQLKVTSYVVAISLLGLTALAGVPRLVNFQGQLKNNIGSPLVNDTLAVEFKIYDAASAGNVKWSEIDTVRTDANGLFTILLGKKSPIPDSVFNDSLRWLGIKVGSDAEISPRSQLSSVGYSYASSQWASSGTNLFRLNGNVGIGTATPGAKLDVGGTLLVNPSNSFVGVNRSTQITTAEFFGVKAPVTNDYGGMYVGTLVGGSPFYGYISPTGAQYDLIGWTYLDGQTGDWRVNLANSDVLAVQSVGGKVGIGTTSPASKLDVRGDLTLETGADPVLFTASQGGEQSRYLNLINSPDFRSASGLKAGGVVVADDYTYAYPGKNDLFVKGEVWVGGDLHLSGNIIGGATPWTPFPFAAGFGNYGFGFQNAQYRKIGDIVYLRGKVAKLNQSDINYTDTLGILPVGFRPPATVEFSTSPQSGPSITSDGIVRGGVPGWYYESLDGVFFSTSY